MCTRAAGGYGPHQYSELPLLLESGGGLQWPGLLRCLALLNRQGIHLQLEVVLPHKVFI